MDDAWAGPPCRSAEAAGTAARGRTEPVRVGRARHAVVRIERIGPDDQGKIRAPNTV